MISLLLTSIALATGTHVPGSVNGHAVDPRVNHHVSDHNICTTERYDEWAGTTYRWSIHNDTLNRSKAGGRGVLMVLRYLSGEEIRTASERGPQVAEVDLHGSRRDVFVLAPGQFCYGVLDPKIVPAVVRDEENVCFEVRMVVQANATAAVYEPDHVFFPGAYTLGPATKPKCYQPKEAIYGKIVVTLNDF